MKDLRPPRSAAGPRRWKALLRVLTFLTVTVVAAVVLLLVALQAPPVGTRLTNMILGHVSIVPDSRLAVGEVRGNWLTRLELHDLRMTRGDKVLAAADTLRLGMRPWALLAGTVNLSSVEIVGPAVSSNFATAISGGQGVSPEPAASSRHRSGTGIGFRVDRLVIRRGQYENATAGSPSTFLVGVTLAARDLRFGKAIAAVVDSLSLQVARSESAGELARLEVAGFVAGGRVAINRLNLNGPGSVLKGQGIVAFDSSDSVGAIEIELQADPIDLGDLSLFIPRLEWSGNVTADIALSGPRLDTLSGNAAITCTALHLGDLHFGASRLVADFAEGHAGIEAAIVWEEARAALHGWVRPLDQTPSYDLALELDRLPRRLPGTPWWESLSQHAASSTHLRIQGHGYGDAVLQVEGDVTSDAGRIELAGGLRLRPAVEWDVRQLAIENLDVARWTGAATTSSITGIVTASGSGTATESMQVSATWDFAASHYGTWELLSCDGHANLVGSQLHGTMQLATPAGDVAIDSVMVRVAGDGAFEIPTVRFRGLDLARITGNASVQSDLQGALRLEGATSSGSAIRPFLLRLRATGRLALEPSRFRDHDIQGGAITFRLHDGTLDGTVTMRSDGGQAELRAEARPFGRPFELTVREFRFKDVDVRAWAKTPAPTRLTGVLSGHATAQHDRKAVGRERSSNEGWGSLASWSADLRLDPSEVGSLSISTGEVSVGAAAEGFEGRAHLRTEAGDATLEARAVPGERGPSGSARIALPFAILTAMTGLDSVAAEGGLQADASFTGIDPESARFQARITGRGRLDDWQVDSLSTVVHLANGALTVDTLTLRSNAATVGGSGRVAISDSTRTSPSDLRLLVQTQDPAHLRPLLHADTLDLATGRLEVRVKGFRSALSVAVRATFDSLTWNDVTVEQAQAEARGILTDRGHLLESEATAHMARLRRHALQVDAADAKATFDGSALRGDLTVHLDDAHQVSLAAEASRDTSGLRVLLTDAVIDTPERHWKLLRTAQLHHGGERWSLDSLEIRAGSAFVLAHGTLDRNAQQDFSLQLNRLDLGVLAASLGREDLDGILDAQVAVTGEGAAPRIDGSVRIVATASGQPAGVVSGRVHVADSRAGVHLTLTTAAQDSATIVASIPLQRAGSDSTQKATGPLVAGDLRATAQHFPLAGLVPLFPTGKVSNLQGILDAAIHLTRTGTQVRGSGQLGIAGATIGLPTLGVEYQDMQLVGEIDGDRLTLREARVRSDKGELELEGDVRVVSLSLVEPSLTAKFRDFVAVSAPDLRVQASGELQLAGSLVAPEIKGQVTADACTYYITDAAVGGAQAGFEVELTPADVRMLEETFGSQYRPGTSPFKGVYEASSLDLQISLDHDNWVRKRRAPRLALEVTGNVHVRKPAHGELDLRGRLAPVPGRGTIEQFGRTFDFVGGEVLLNGPMRDHTVDIRTEYKARTPGESDEPDVVVHLDVKSEADKLRLVLSSEPSLSETEIISYITTGRNPIKPQSDAGTGSDAAALAADIGLSQVTGALEDVVQEKVGLDVLQVRYDAIQGATLMAGRYLNRSLYIGVRQPLQYRESGLSSSQHPYQTAVDMEYAAYPWLLFDVQGEASLVRSFIRARHAY